jgi:hypothetical protein
MLIGWNGNSSGDGILGGAAPGGIGVWGVVGSGETTPVPGDCGVYGTAISTGVSGFASGDVTGSGTGVAGMGKVGVHGHGLNVGSASDFGVVGFSEAGTGVAGSSTSGIGISASSKTNIGLVAGNHETEILWMREMIGQAYVPTFRSVLTPQGAVEALAFAIDRTSRRFADLSTAEAAAIIASGKGGARDKP